ncbi:MAG: hypothetical protein ACFCUQ_15570 [Kiloniellales bacterium]
MLAVLTAADNASAAGCRNPDEIRLYIPRFAGPETLARNVATTLNLSIWPTLRRIPWPDNPDNNDFGRGTIIWDHEPLDEQSHEFASRAAQHPLVNAQLVLWGKAQPYGEGVAVEVNLTLPRYQDFRERRFEIWQVALPQGTVAVDLPRRRFELASIVMLPEALTHYNLPSANLVYAEPEMQQAIGTLGDSFVGLIFEHGRAKVRVGDVIGWVQAPNLSKVHPEVIEMTAGILRLFRCDWEGAASSMARVISNPGTPAAVRVDAHLYRGMALEQLGKSGRDEFEEAFALNPYSRTTIRYLVMSDLAALARQDLAATRRQELRERIAATLDQHYAIFPPDDAWLDQVEHLLSSLP